MATETVVIGLNWVGDNVLALPTYRALQQRYRGEGGIALAAPHNVAPLFESLGIFRDVIPWQGSTRRRVEALRPRRFRRAVILPNSFRAAAVAFAAGIEERWGYSTDLRSLLLTNRVERALPRRHQLADYSALLTAMGAAPVVDDIPTVRLPVAIRDKGHEALKAAGLRLNRPLVALHPGGLYGRAKHWGDERFGQLGQRLRRDGYEVIILTSPNERHQAASIAERFAPLPMIGHEGDVLHLAAAISHCSVVVTNDSGPLHLAAALAVPSVSIFGPTDPGRTVIPGASRVLRNADLNCVPCYQRECPLGHHRCMTEIGVDDVYAAAISLAGELDEKFILSDGGYGGGEGSPATRRG